MSMLIIVKLLTSAQVEIDNILEWDITVELSTEQSGSHIFLSIHRSSLDMTIIGMSYLIGREKISALLDQIQISVI
jgi:hypothetical protein